VIGLTGNIATGKSVVAHMLSELGAEHIDADRLAHQVMAAGTPTCERIAAAFGTQILRPNGSVDRGKLGNIVFADANALARLEAIVHPEVIARARQLIADSTATVVVVEAIKLIESGMVVQLCDVLWVVTASRAVQIRRLVEQRRLSYEEAVLRVDAQPPQGAKVAQADVVIDNDDSLENTRQQVIEAWRKIGGGS